MLPKPDAFLSYTRFDDREGKITKFRKRLSETVEEVSGERFEIFQDVDDETGIGLGQRWRSVLDEMLDQTRFFIPILTPKFFNSQLCREELTKFLELEQNAGRDDLVLPIYYIRCEVLEDSNLRGQDQLASIVRERQCWDWRGLRLQSFTAKAVAESLDTLARQIQRARRRALTVLDTPLEVASADDRQQPTPKSLAPRAVFRDIDAPWCPEMVVIPSGRFLMGSPHSEDFYNENPTHEVVLEHPFALGRFPVTFEKYDYFCEQTDLDKPGDEGWGRAKRPVIGVSWDKAKAYCEWLSEITGQRYRLPSEAEWEYACRAGTTTAYAFGDEITIEHANFDSAVGKTTEVGSYPENAWGIYDMHGNVWECVEDCWNETYEGAPNEGSAWLNGDCECRVQRGGSWLHHSTMLRSAFRCRHNWRTRDRGFRVARTL